DARTDLFSFGLVLYEMATGQRAFSGNTEAVVHDAILNDTVPRVQDLNAALPHGLDAIIARTLEKDRSRRYQSAGEIREALARVRNDSGPARPAYTRWTLVTIAALTVLAVGVWRGLARSNTRFTLSPSDTVVLADISNDTGDPAFDKAL